MGSHRVAGAPLDFAALRDELGVPGDFASQALIDADQAASSVELPDEDATNIPFVTIDPPGSHDLDQAVHIARDGTGYLVSYAIADVASFVRAGSALDEETQRRGETLYFPDMAVPLHPPSLSEDAASLRPGTVRPAALWRMSLDETGEVTAVDVRRARIRSREQLDYETVQRDIVAGTAADAVVLLADVGRLRLAIARSRHAINLDLPEQHVHRDGPHGWTLTFREPLPAELFNAEISLLTGVCAARLMLDAGYGILRIVPPPDHHAVVRLRHAAHALGVAWPAGAAPGDVLASVRRDDGRHVAFIEHAVALLRGAAYVNFDGAPPAQTAHVGIGAPYAHVTAPLRRLVDRYGTEICLAACSGQPVPKWVGDRLPQLPDTMRQADQRAHLADRAVVDMTEAWLLRDRVGDIFTATVIDADPHAGTVVIDEPAVRARCAGDDLPIGADISVRLVEADITKREVRFELA
jgi:exoribonuclease R